MGYVSNEVPGLGPFPVSSYGAPDRDQAVYEDTEALNGLNDIGDVIGHGSPVSTHEGAEAAGKIHQELVGYRLPFRHDGV